MRYIPSSRYTLDQIAEQCRAAINRPVEYQQPVSTVDYSEWIFKSPLSLGYDAPVFHMKDYPSLVR